MVFDRIELFITKLFTQKIVSEFNMSFKTYCLLKENNNKHVSVAKN